MIPLVKITSHPELVSEIVGQFAFMKLMAELEDKSWVELCDLDIDDVFQAADDYFIQFTSFEKTIDTRKTNLESELKEFLSQYKHITDVTAIQQNIHYRLSKLN